MNELQVFNFKENEVRTVTINNNPYFVLKDVCDVLELKNATMVADRLDEDEVTKFNLGGLSGVSNVINESGLYAVILRSDKPKAKEFRKWVTSEVLPAIRKTGSYQQVPRTPREMAMLSLQANEETAKRVDVVEKEIIDIKENAKLEPSEYNLVSKLVNKRVWGVLEDFRLSKTKEQKSLLYRDINSGINQLCGICTRAQIRQKHFDNVLKFIDEWCPSTITKHKIRDLENEKTA